MTIRHLIKNYYISIDKNVTLDSLDNAIVNIDMLTNSNGIISVVANEEKYNRWLKDNICITVQELKNGKLEGAISKEKIIFFKNNRIYVKTIKETDSNNIGTDNILLRNVKEFEVNIKGKLIYYKIVMRDGEVRIRCV